MSSRLMKLVKKCLSDGKRLGILKYSCHKPDTDILFDVHMFCLVLTLVNANYIVVNVTVCSLLYNVFHIGSVFKMSQSFPS